MVNKEQFLKLAQNDEDRRFLSYILDKQNACLNKNIYTASHFLDAHQQGLLLQHLSHFAVKPILWGGYPEAERKMAFFLPDYLEEAPTEAISLLQVSHHAPKPPTHRDYLGSAIGLGLSRDGIGDILVSPGGAQLLIRKDLENYFLSNYCSAGRVSLSTEILPLSALSLPLQATREKTVTLASLRADAAIAAAFTVSRALAAEAIAHGLVYINDLPVSKSGQAVSAGDKLKWQGHGRAILTEIGGQSRKGRNFATFRIFI